MPEPVTLAAVKAEPRLKDMALVKYSRLSVQPVTIGGMDHRLQDGRYEGRKALIEHACRAATAKVTFAHAAAAMIWASTWARRFGERQPASVSENRSSTPSSNAATTVSCT